jgi:tetratricopeptide (TPR) repeat protein
VTARQDTEGPAHDDLTLIDESTWDDGLRVAFGEGELPPRCPAVDALAGGQRFQVSGEIGVGGMGIVRLARDLDLDRDVAMKVLRDECIDDPAAVRRFLREARIGGRLQHPGVVPIHQVGVDEERRPYFTMRLVRGRTLASLLAAREDPARARIRLLRIFEQVGQTVAYAHSRGIVHGDLKPSNVMVGAFGEVQVLDWGVAREIGSTEPDDDRPREHGSEENSNATQVGIVSGTPAYMAPEQARGLITTIDERTDVFALGGTLCEILTGGPPYVSDSGDPTLTPAIEAKLDDAHRRLEAPSIDREMADLARDCLQAEMDDRPRDAAAVAARVSAHLSSLEERARQAEIVSAREAVHAIEERRAHRLTRIIGVLIVAVLVAIGVTVFLVHDATRTRAQRAQHRVAAVLEEAAGHAGQREWDEVSAAAGRAEAILEDERGLLASDIEKTLRERIAGYVEAARDAQAVTRLSEIRGADLDDVETDAAYAEAFEAIGLDIDDLDPEAVGAAIRARGAAASEFALALDDWAARHRGPRSRRGDRRVRLLRCAKAADPDPVRNELRDALISENLDVLRGFADRTEELPPATLELLVPALGRSGEADLAIRVLEGGVRRHPGDYWLNFELARTLARADRANEAVLYARICMSLRPTSGHPRAFYGTMLLRSGDTEGAITVLRDARNLAPDRDFVLFPLAQALREAGQDEEAAQIERSIKRKGRGPGGGSAGRSKELLEAVSELVRIALTPGEDGRPPASRDDSLRRAREMIGRLIDHRRDGRGPQGGGPRRGSPHRLLEELRNEPRLAGVRDGDRLADLSEGERAAWIAIWKRIDTEIESRAETQPR